MVVTVEGQSVTSLAFHPLDVMRWGAAIVDLGGAETMADLSARLHEALSSVAAGAEGRPSIVRVTLSGATPLHRALADAALVEAECRSAAASVGDDVHVERVRVATRPMDGAERSDPLAPLFLGAFADEELVARLLEEAGRLRAALPVIAASELPRDRKALAALLEEAWALAGAAFEPV